MVKLYGPSWIAVICAGVLLLSSGQAIAQCRYEVRYIEAPETLGNLQTTPGGLNDRGEACGYISLGPDVPRAFAWDQKTGVFPVPLLPGASWSSAADISDTPVHGPFGLVVGSMNTPGAVRAFKYDGISMTDLGTLGGLHSAAYAVNSSNWIVGAAGATQSNQAALWRDGSVINIGALLGPLVHSSADRVNAIGQLVGNVTNGQSDQNRGYLWQNSRATILPLPPGTVYSRATAINNKGAITIIGWAPQQSGPSLSQAFVYAGGQWTALQALGTIEGFDFINNVPADINDAGVVVGASTTTTTFGLPYIWQDGIIRRLDLLTVDPAPDIHVQVRFARKINSQGQILAQGTVQFLSEGYGQLLGLVLTPVAALPGDTNCDQQVNIDDLTDVILNWNNVGGAADLNFDQSVDVLDLAQIVENWSVTK